MSLKVLAGSRPGRGRPRPSQDLLLLTQPGVLTPEPFELFSLRARQAVVALAAIELVARHPVTQTRLRDRQLPRDLRDRPIALTHQGQRASRNSFGYGLGIRNAILSEPSDEHSRQVSTKAVGGTPSGLDRSEGCARRWRRFGRRRQEPRARRLVEFREARGGAGSGARMSLEREEPR
jgi:hypothetical protein